MREPLRRISFLTECFNGIPRADTRQGIVKVIINGDRPRKNYEAER